MTIRAISWDVDGTLYEMPALRRALRGLALERGLRAPIATLRALSRLGSLRRTLESVRARGGDLAGVALPDGRDAIEAEWILEAVRRAGPRPGVADLLRRQRERGLVLVATSDHPAEAKLEALGLRACFDRVLVGEALGALKPSPRLLLATLEALGLPATALLHVGDRAETDGVAASAAGCASRILAAGAVPGDLP